MQYNKVIMESFLFVFKQLTTIEKFSYIFFK